MITKHTILLSLILVATGCNTLTSPAAGGKTFEASNRPFPYVSQKGISGNACGPVSLVNAFGAGSEKWQSALSSYSSPRSAVIRILRTYGSRPSVSFKKRERWNKLMGMNLEDLTITAQEMANHSEPSLPQIKSIITIPDGDQANIGHLKTLHYTLSNSFKNGLPPIANISRIAFRPTQKDNIKVWDTIGSHSVVITQVSAIQSLNGSSSFTFSYVDPAVGKELKGVIKIGASDTSAPKHILVVDAPQSNIFKDILSPSTPSHLSLSSLIGAF